MVNKDWSPFTPTCCFQVSRETERCSGAVFQPVLDEPDMQGYRSLPNLSEVLILSSHGIGTITCMFLRLVHIPVCGKQNIHRIKK